jgi:ATP-dependent Lhr-like helicase
LQVLRSLGENKIIAQLPSGELIIDLVGERIINSHTFYTAFDVPEEYKLINNGKIIGTLPITIPYIEGQMLLFGGYRWSIVSIDAIKKIITLSRSNQGKAPSFGGEPAPVHKMVRQRMYALYHADNHPRYCDEQTCEIIRSSRQFFTHRNIDHMPMIIDGSTAYWFIWNSDRVIDTIKVIATLLGYAADRSGCCIVIEAQIILKEIALEIKRFLESTSIEFLTQVIDAQPLGKFDKYLSKELIKKAFITEKLDINSTIYYLNNLLEQADVFG